ncbi:MAG: helicase C-terminal domain-containing protein [Burkholderiaceae bacterium]
MSELAFQKQAELWGQAYELLVKRGVLAHLIESGLLDPEHSQLVAWKRYQLLDVSKALNRSLGILDETLRDRVKAAVEHMALTAYGVGYTAMREYLRSLPKAARMKLKLRALWCPLLLPDDDEEPQQRMRRDREAFHRQFALHGLLDPQLSAKGQPANADFVLWLSGDLREDYLLVQEYSFDMPRAVADFSDQEAHLEELTRHRRLIDGRGVFARVTAEVDGESFKLSEDIRHHLNALTSGNKPFYKLCQACSYAAATAEWLRRDGVLAKPCNVRALAITPNGLESIAARFLADNPADPRRQLMEQMGKAYRQARKLADGDEEGLLLQVRSVFRNMLSRLPGSLKNGLKSLARAPEPGDDYLFEFEEDMGRFANPADLYDLEAAMALVPNAPGLDAFFGQPASAALAPLLTARAKDGRVSLRDVHAAAIVAAMGRSVAGKVNVIALEGNPGIGKTTAVREHLEKKPQGYLFLYVSPRVVINRDVTQSLARRDGEPSGILTITTNAALISSAPRWHMNQVDAGLATRKRVDGAVVVDGVPELVKPNGAILVISPEQEQEIEAAHAGSRIGKTTLSENEDIVDERSMAGVLSSMSTTTRDLLALNPDVNRVVMTAALQGFREKAGGKTTMDALSNLFRGKAGDPAGVRERQAFAERIPNIVVMVDELAGDGAGSPFVHAVATWLHDQFIGCFEDGPSPFIVTLVIADASLANEVVLSRYLAAGQHTPDKILVSKSHGRRAFDLALSRMPLGAGGPKTALHVMTNSFPASRLTVEYKVRLTSVDTEVRSTGEMETARQAVRRVVGEAVLNGAKEEILQALRAGAAQVIYFAQDKNFLGDLASELAREEDLGPTGVAVLDSSVPGHERKKLVEPATRDAIRVFLMTSSGARGVSFPKTDCIIAAVPRFAIEAALMEIAQLVYRGRGNYRDEGGSWVSGDTVPRRLVMLVDDYVVEDEEEPDPRQWLRQSVDLLTLLVMLRSAIFTRITGDAGLRQSLALVPVGRVGLEELVSLMSQNVTQFVKEADVVWRRIKDPQKVGLIKNARANVIELFSRTKLQAVTAKADDPRTMVRYRDAKELCDLACGPLRPLLVYAARRTSVPEHVFVSGPAFLENWGDFDKMEVFGFEGHTTEVSLTGKRVIAQLLAIDEDRSLPQALRQPAANLLRILQREKKDAANEFNTLKNLKSPNTWIAVPSGYIQFMARDRRQDGEPFEVEDPDAWRDALAQSLSATSAVMPPIPRYEEYPWAASVGNANPLKLDTVFDDRYFMASNELNLLNTLLLCDEGEASGS